ncbi:cupin domain-containing protein [Cupriavidus sp. NPDC089707]|uniref:cupin domain-containing protein n=1 Tax=Cupriavidus sp. NPDC089707 TaxID=3363963 RepID=UPI00382B7925
MSVIRNAELPRSALPGIDHVTLAGSAQGLAHLSVWQQSIAPGAATPPHRHDCEEVVIIQSGRGELHLQGRVQAFGPDTTLVVPRNAVHQIINVGEAPLALIGILSVSPVPVFFPDGTPIELPWHS